MQDWPFLMRFPRVHSLLGDNLYEWILEIGNARSLKGYDCLPGISKQPVYPGTAACSHYDTDFAWSSSLSITRVMN